MIKSIMDYVYSYFSTPPEQHTEESIKSYQIIEGKTRLGKHGARENEFKVHRSKKYRKRNIPAEVTRWPENGKLWDSINISNCNIEKI